ncbi:MAG: hypothetical protein AAF846_07020 [Chloroflexota bacterium]
MAINIADVFLFPDIILGNKVTIEGWQYDSGESTSRNLLSSTPDLSETTPLIHIQMEEKIVGFTDKFFYKEHRWHINRVEVTGIITTIDSQNNYLTLANISRIMVESEIAKARIYRYFGNKSNTKDKYKLSLIPINKICLEFGIHLKKRVRVSGILLRTQYGFVLIDLEQFIRPPNSFIRTRVSSEEVEKLQTRYNNQFPDLFRQSIFVDAIQGYLVDLDPKNVRRGSGLWTMDCEIIGELVQSEKPHFLVELHDCVMVIHHSNDHMIICDLY